MAAISLEAMQLMMQQMEAMRKELAEEKQQREAGKKEREDDKAELASLRRMAQLHRRTTMYQPFSSPEPQAASAEPGVYQHQKTPTMRVVDSSLTELFSTPQRGGKASAESSAAAAMGAGQSQVAAEELIPNTEGLAALRKKMKEPEPYSGADSESVREFCDTARNYLRSFLGSSQIGRLSYIFSRTTGNARQWIKGQMETAEQQAEHVELEWFMLEEKFIREMEGPNHTLKLWHDLQALRYGVGKCKELRDFNLEWDKLRVRIQESSGEQGAGVMWGMQYGDNIRLSNPTLYDRTIMLGGVPSDLAQWKVKLTMAVAMQTDVMDKPSASSARAPSNRFNAWSSNNRSGAVRDNGMEAEKWTRDSSGQDAGADRQPMPDGMQSSSATASAAASVHAMTTGGANKRLVQLNPDHLERLFDTNRCFKCYKKNHKAAECKSAAATNPPTEEQMSN
jgi:hypothetical protein